MTKYLNSLKLVTKIGAILLVTVACEPNDEVPAEESETEFVQVTAINPVHQIATYVATEGTDPSFVSAGTPIDLGETIKQIGEPLSLPNEVVGDIDESVPIETEDGDQVYFRRRWFLPDSVAAVVVAEDAVLYTRPEAVAATGVQIQRGEILAAAPVEREDVGVSFVEILYFDHDNRRAVDSRYLRSDVISTEEHDVRAATLLFVATRTEDPTARREILSIAVELPNNEFSVPIRVEAAQFDSAVVTALTIARQVGVPFHTVTTELYATVTPGSGPGPLGQVDVLQAPYSGKGEFVGYIATVTTMPVIAVTEQSYQYLEHDAPWYLVLGEPPDPTGWVHGGYLEEVRP